MPDDFEKDPLVYSEQVKQKMTEDPELAEMMRGLAAEMRQAHHAWKTGQYASFDDAMEAITGQRPEAVDDDEVPEAVIQALAKLKDESEP